ncbi:MAG: S8 family serine peptidase, partial [Gemmatimonadota bacterium]
MTAQSFTGARGFLSLVGSSVLLQCTEPQRPPPPPSPPDVAASGNASVTADTDGPFYYFFRQKIPLTAEPRELVVQLSRGSDAGVVTGLAARAGVNLGSVTKLPQMPDHWLVGVQATSASPSAERTAELLRAVVGVQFAEPTYRVVANGARIHLVNRLVVRFVGGATPMQVDSFARALSLRLERPPRPDSAFFEHLFQFPAGVQNRALAIAAMASESPIVAWAAVDKMSDARPAYTPTDPFYSLQYHLKNMQYFNGVPVDVNVEAAWDLTIGSGVRVAIIDDGVDIQHANSGGGFAGDLIGAFAGAQGYDAVNSAQAQCQGDAFTPQQNDTHGTAIAGIIAATHNNGQGVVGISPGVVFTVVRIFCGTYFPGEAAYSTDAQVASAINFAWQAGSHVINNSWATQGAFSAPIQSAIDQATTMGRSGKGTVVVFAAGNSYPQAIGFPNNLPNVATVGAITRFGPRAFYSQTGVSVDLVAPSGPSPGPCGAGDFVTIDLWGSPGCNDGPGGNINYSATFTGTSAAAPQVAAAAALILSREPNLTEFQVRSRLCQTAHSWGT